MFVRILLLSIEEHYAPLVRRRGRSFATACQRGGRCSVPVLSCFVFLFFFLLFGNGTFER